VCVFSNTEPYLSICRMPTPVGGGCLNGGVCVKGAYCDLHTLTCVPNKGVGDRCVNGNECGEPPLDEENGVECVRGVCVDMRQEGANCWPNTPKSRCMNGRTCRKRAAASSIW
jgi:hypothetical protein